MDNITVVKKTLTRAKAKKIASSILDLEKCLIKEELVMDFDDFASGHSRPKNRNTIENLQLQGQKMSEDNNIEFQGGHLNIVVKAIHQQRLAIIRKMAKDCEVQLTEDQVKQINDAITNGMKADKYQSSLEPSHDYRLKRISEAVAIILIWGGMLAIVVSFIDYSISVVAPEFIDHYLAETIGISAGAFALGFVILVGIALDHNYYKRELVKLSVTELCNEIFVVKFPAGDQKLYEPPETTISFMSDEYDREFEEVSEREESFVSQKNTSHNDGNNDKIILGTEDAKILKKQIDLLYTIEGILSEPHLERN